jgi:hypothetical protein
MALVHEQKWSTAPHDGWAFEKIIIDYAKQHSSFVINVVFDMGDTSC